MNQPPKSVSDLPSPPGRPLVGHLVDFMSDPLTYAAETRDAYGDLVFLRFGPYNLILVSHPDVIGETLQKRWRSLHKDALYEAMVPLLGHGLVTAEGETWKRNRRRAAPAFTSKQIATYADAMVRCAVEWIDQQSSGDEIELHDGMMELTKNIVLETLFGSDLDVDTSAVAHHVEVWMREFAIDVFGRRRFLPSWVPSRGRRRMKKSVDALDETVNRLIEARRATGLGDDLLSRLILAKDDDGGGFDAKGLRDEAVTIFMAGHETTSLALTFTLLLLADHPECEDRLRAEVDEVLGSRDATLEDVASLPYAKAVIQESMRLLPPVWAIGRESQEEVLIGGYQVPPKTQLFVSIWALHRDPRWYDAPEQFLPQRWLNGLEERLPKYAYIPFGAGPRVCIGNRFAMMEAVLVLSTLIQRCRFRPYGAVPPELEPSVTLRPAGPVPARISKRSH